MSNTEAKETEITSSPKKSKTRKSQIESPKHRRRGNKKNSEMILSNIREEGVRSYSLSYCLLALEKEPCNRSLNDILSIKSFLETSELARKFTSDNITDESLQKILYMCSTEMRYLKYPQSKILFRIGDEGTHFYIILKGRIEILKPISYDEMLSGFDYFNHLMALYELDEIFILKKTIEANQANIHIDYSDISILKKIVLSSLLTDFYMNSEAIPSELINIIESCHIDLLKEELDINKNSLDDINYFISTKKLLSNYIGDIQAKKIDRYRGLKQTKIKIKYSLFKYHSFLQLETGSFFGDMALDKKTPRSATIKTIEETHFCYLDIKSYNDFLLAEKQRLTLNEVAFLVNNFFFKAISFFVFEKKYLNQFIYQEHFKSDELCKEDSKVDYIYFIKEGQVELTIKKSVFEIHSLTNYLNALGNDSHAKELSLPLCRNDFENLKDHLKKRMEQSLFITNGKECLGQESLYYGLNYLYTARVITKKCKAYKIDVRSLLKLFQSEVMSYNWFAFNCKNKVKVLKDRFIDIKESQICLIDYTLHNNTLMSSGINSQTLSRSAFSFSSSPKSNRVLKCKIRQLNPLPLFTSQCLTSNPQFTSGELATKETQIAHIQQMFIKKPFETITAKRKEVTTTPLSKTKRTTPSTCNNHYNFVSTVTNYHSHCSLITETRLLSKLKRELENDPMITNNNFVTLANKRKLKLRFQEQMNDLNNTGYNRGSIPKLMQQKRKDRTLSRSRHTFVTEKRNNAIEENTNANSDKEFALTENEPKLNNPSISKMFSGKYFNQRRSTYQNYKTKRMKDNNDNI